MNNCRISMLMTVFNGGAYLKPAVESVLASTGISFEFVIVDNCSTDGSRPYLESLKDPRIRLILNEQNLGQTGALNVGLRACNTPYVARIDADDITLPDRLAWQTTILDENPDVVLVGGGSILIDENGKRLHNIPLPTDADALKGRMVLANCFVHSAICFRRDAAEQAGGYPAEHTVSQDFALFSRLMREGGRLMNSAQPATCLRTHPEQVTKQDAGTRERDETARVIAANLAWAIGGNPDESLGLDIYDFMYRTGSPLPPSIIERVMAAIAALMKTARLNARQKAWLVLYILGGACGGRSQARLTLTAHLARLDPAMLLSGEFLNRWGRAMLPASLLPLVRRLRS